MAEILIEETAAQENAVEDSPKARLEKFLRENKVKIARNAEELYAHSIKDDDGEEVDEFMRLREGWRKEDDDSHREIN
jgi:hypothetical protein